MEKLIYIYIINSVNMYNSVLSSFMTYNRVCNKSNTTYATCVAGTACPSRAPEFFNYETEDQL